MMSQKTTSFSKILASKTTNNHQYMNLNSVVNGPTSQMAPSPPTSSSSSSGLLNTTDTSQPQQKDPKTTEYNTSNSTTTSLEHYDEEEEAYEEDVDDDVNNLEFSDHAGLFTSNHRSISELVNEHDSIVMDEDEDDEDRHRLTNYDIYKLTKKNYKLTFNKSNNSPHFAHKTTHKEPSIRSANNNINNNNNNNNTTKTNNIGSNTNNNNTNKRQHLLSMMAPIDLNHNHNQVRYSNTSTSTSTCLKQQQIAVRNTTTESNEEEYEERNDDDYEEDEDMNQEEDEEEEDDDEEEDYEEDEENYMYEGAGQVEASLNESIMNWSMKISNYGSDIVGGNKYRSQSRSPPPMPPSQSRRQASQKNNNNQPVKSSVTSWGQVKHSKSSSSHLGSPLETSRCDYGTQTSPVQICTASIPGASQQLASPTQQPLYKLFQTSRSNMTDASLTRSSRRDTLDEQHQNLLISPPQNRMQNNSNNLKSESRTTSFSQIRQRSVSSYVLGSNSTTITTVTGIDTESKQQSQPVKKSVGIQHPPPKCDQSMQTPARTTAESPSTIVCMLVGPPKHLLTNREELIRCARLAVRQATAVQAKRSQSLTVNQASVKKASLPDLTFLNDYSSTPPAKTVTNKTVDQSTTTVSSTTGGELLKRKTLKSIKRYRQTKQNTEPCGLLLAAQHTQMAQQTLHQQYFTQHTQILPDNHLSLAPTSPDLAKKQLSKKYNNNSNKSTTKHRQSPPVNNTTSNERTPVENSTSSTSSSISSPTPRPRSLGAKKHQQQQSPGHKNVPYPPPLPPPHHNHHHASNLQRQTSLPGYTKPPQPTSSNKQPLKSCLKRKESSSAVPTPTTNTNTTKRIEAEVEQTTTINPKAASMFVPYVGYLFTCDQGSCTRYCYYNGLEKRRKMKLYKQLTSSARATNNRRHLRQDDNSEEEDDEEDEEDEIDDDEEGEQDELKSSGEKEALTETSKSTQARVTVTNSSIVTNTYKSENDLRSLAKKQVKFSNSSNQTSTERTVEAPPLQYDTLIAMLKSRKPSAPQNKPTAPPPPLPPQQSPQFIKKRVNKPHQAPAVPIPTASVSKTFHHHHHMAIEADSISLASLSESPPSEFKFSDEEMDHDEEDDHEEDQVAAAALVLNEMAAIQSQVLMSKHGAQLVDYSKSIQIQQQRIAQLAEIRNKKKVFHNVLLNDQKLNNLKEILVEIKQQQHQNTNTTSNNSSSSSTSSASSASSNNNTSSTSSSSSSSSASSSALHQPQTTTNSIERLCQYLFDILKQSLKPIDTTLGLIRSTSASQSQEQLSSTLGQKQMSLAAATESNHVALSYSQYTQLWMLIEQTISSILSGNGPTNGGKFNLPREAIVNMFQEINRYSMLTNQTYLIDGVNSSPSATLGSNASMNTTAANSHQSQLRRKHHYMVMLMGLKFKFQLFIVNLLNHKQLSNWFDLLNRDRQLLKVYYDFKYTSSMSANQTNTSGDSGVSSEFMYASHCSSTNANSCSISSNISTQANHHLYELTSLANVSIFEHDEYYSYFHKLLQQFQHVDFHIKLNATCGPPTATITTTPSPTQTPTATQPKLPSTIKQGKIPHSNTTTIYQNSQPNSSGGSSNSSSGGSSSTFNLKSISKRLNIKSWFTSSSSMVNQTPPTKTHHNYHHHNSSATTRLTNFTQQHKHKMSVAEKSGHLGAGVGCLLAHHNSAMTSNPIYSKPPPPSNHRHLQANTTNTNESLMKHSLSEPSLNSIINMS